MTNVRHRATGIEPLLVGIDRVDGARKTFFADELSAFVRSALLGTSACRRVAAYPSGRSRRRVRERDGCG